MAATTRWVQYDIAETGTVGVGDGATKGRGSRGYHVATNTGSKDSFDIGSSTQNKLYVSFNSDGPYELTLTSGTDLDPRFVAKDITEKIHAITPATVDTQNAQCVWENGNLKLYAGDLATLNAAVVSSGTDTAHVELGFQTGSGKVNGTDWSVSNNYNGGIVVSGTYNGFFDETYTIVINEENNIQTPVHSVIDTYTGSCTAGGSIANTSAAITYTITIDVTGGRTTMGAGAGNCPTMSWTASAVDSSGGPVELLYADYWYYVGTLGLMVKFTDATFGSETFTVTCNQITTVDGSNAQAGAGTAEFYWGSTRGDDATTTSVTSESSYVRLGTRGLYIVWDGSNNFAAGDTFTVVCSPPQPQSYDISSLNYGNVTVSTESPVKAVMFEIMSGAVEISTVKFGLQNNGNFQYHDPSGGASYDTKFRFGTVGPGDPAGSSPIDGLEWRTSVTAADLTGVAPIYLSAINENLSVVSDADSSEDVSVSTFAGMVADPIWLNIKLGASEVGANSTINYRIYFDYS